MDSQQAADTLLSPSLSEKYIRYRGILFPAEYYSSEDLLYTENEFQVQDSDIFNVTFPKSGTTWMLEILSLIQKNGDPTWCRTVPNYERSPWVEIHDSQKHLEKSTSQRLITSHLPIHLFPKSYFQSKAKIVYTARNPKDVVVSMYYFYQMSVYLEDPYNFQETLDLFLKGEVIYGSWFEHIRGWLEAKDRINMLFITYEELKKDLRESVAKICQFLGKNLDDEAIDSVVKNASFSCMKDNKMSNFTLVPETMMDHKRSPFMRKGIAGDWKNHFTVAQNKYFNSIYQERMKGITTKFTWD